MRSATICFFFSLVGGIPHLPPVTVQTHGSAEKLDRSARQALHVVGMVGTITEVKRLVNPPGNKVMELVQIEEFILGTPALSV